jgi:hypothetical protein
MLMKLLSTNVSVWFGILMIVTVLAGAITFSFTDFMYDRIFGTRRTVFIFILYAYGFYRIVRVYQTIKSTKNETKL